MTLAKFKTRPMKHQIDVLKMCKDQHNYALLLEMGTGKTKITLDNIFNLYAEDKIDRAMVVAPKGVYLNWLAEIDKHLPESENAIIGYWKSMPNAREKENLVKLLVDATGRLKLFLVNTEAFSSEKILSYAKDFVGLDGKCMVVVDEATKIKNIKAARTKSIIKYTRAAGYRRILTGTPVTNSPLDLYSMFYFLDPRILGYNSFYAFRATYANVVQQTLNNGRHFDKIVGYKNVEELKKRISPFSYRLTKSECIDLPEKIYMPSRMIDLNSHQQASYASMKQHCITEINNSKEITVTAMIAKLMKLQQIACNFIIDEKGVPHKVSEEDPRLAALFEIIEESSGKTIIFSNFRYCINLVSKALADEYGKETVVTYYGDTSDDDREEAKTRFQDPEDPCRFFVGNPSTAGFGLTLTEASNVIFYSSDYDIEKRQQAEDRAHRIGQTKHVCYTDIVCKGTIDLEIVKSLKNKVKIQDLILGGSWQTLVA